MASPGFRKTGQQDIQDEGPREAHRQVGEGQQAVRSRVPAADAVPRPPLLAAPAFHARCQGLTHSFWGEQGMDWVFLFFSKDAELAPRSNDHDSLRTNQRQKARRRRPGVAVHRVQGEQLEKRASLRALPAAGRGPPPSPWGTHPREAVPQGDLGSPSCWEPHRGLTGATGDSGISRPGD